MNNLTVIENNSVAVIPDEVFAEKYFSLRQQEGRIYTDGEVALLPVIDSSHPHYKEWLIRQHSCKALLHYIKQKDIALNILQVGCGNGWLSAQLANNTTAEVTGLDTNNKELEQAKKVFSRIQNLNFINGSLETEDLKDKKFDMIIIAAAIPYFPSLKQTIELAIEHLTLLGDIHILDSPFYQQQELEAARQSTQAYYDAVGFPEIAGHYHHHSLSELENFQYKILQHPDSWKNKLSIKKNPFYWIVIKNKYQ